MPKAATLLHLPQQSRSLVEATHSANATAPERFRLVGCPDQHECSPLSCSFPSQRLASTRRQEGHWQAPTRFARHCFVCYSASIASSTTWKWQRGQEEAFVRALLKDAAATQTRAHWPDSADPPHAMQGRTRPHIHTHCCHGPARGA